MADLATRDDIRDLVAAFYRGIDADPVLGPFFAGVDWEAHLPRMVVFWSAVAFRTGGYRGRPLEVHARLPGLAPEHFAAWLARFHATVDARFAGPVAESVKARAEQVAVVFQLKLGLAVGAEPEIPLPLSPRA